MLVFYGSTLDAYNAVAWIIHSFTHSSLDEMSAQGMMGFSAKDLPKIQVRPLCCPEISILFQVESRIHCSGVAGLRSPFPRWLSAGAALCSHRPLSLSLPHGSPPSSKLATENLPPIHPFHASISLSLGRSQSLWRTRASLVAQLLKNPLAMWET